MNKEKEIIKRIAELLPRSALQLNALFESDSEILDYNGKKMLFTTDEFSNEDLFRDDDPYMLGWNLTAGTISDILASGGKPLFYAHCIALNEKKWDNDYIVQFSKGIADALKKTGAAFIGGDIGRSDNWRYTGIVIGESEKPLTRKGAKSGDIIFMTGAAGAGNLEAAIKLYSDRKIIDNIIKNYKTYFNIRTEESRLIRDYASSCIDSSDGILNALNTIADINDVGYEIADIPYLKTGVLACKLLSMPKTLLFMGECGEYELVFTVKNENEDLLLKFAKTQGLDIKKIGKINTKYRKILIEGKREINFNGFNINARDYENVKDYLNDLVAYITA
ncbi:MAG: thiamine-monophosphate kinase [Bacteroidia bacterium]|nr:thiamine-monophosphate kinase [Bacteroidia bacterium]